MWGCDPAPPPCGPLTKAAVPAVLFALEKHYRLPRATVVAILQGVGTGFQMIAIPALG